MFLDLATDPGTVRSRAEIRFRCWQPGAATFADRHASAVNRVTCNGKGLDPGAALSDGRLHLPGLAAGNMLTVDAELGYSPAGRGLTRFADPADGVDYALGYGYPTSAPSMFCCFDQPDLRADMTLTVSTPAGWECVANGVVTDRPAKGEAGTWRFATVPAMKRTTYFSEALPAVSGREVSVAGRLARLLYPSTLADSATIGATEAALVRGGLSDPLRLALLEQHAILRRILAARSKSHAHTTS